MPPDEGGQGMGDPVLPLLAQWIFGMAAILAAAAAGWTVRLMYLSGRSTITFSLVYSQALIRDGRPSFHVSGMLTISSPRASLEVSKLDAVVTYGYVTLHPVAAAAHQIVGQPRDGHMNQRVAFPLTGLEAIPVPETLDIQLDIRTADGGKFRKKFKKIPVQREG